MLERRSYDVGECMGERALYWSEVIGEVCFERVSASASLKPTSAGWP